MTALTGTGPGLRLRVFGAMSLVVVAGAGTLFLIAELVAPSVFSRHLAEAGLDQNTPVAQHVYQGFAWSLFAGIATGVVAACLVATAVAALVARRIVSPITSTAETTNRLAAGDYAARVPPTRMGPELADLADSVNALAQRLETSEKARLQLLTDLAHELRTPLASIDATVEAITDGVLPVDATTRDTLTRQSRRLSRLIDDLTAVSRADEHAFLLRPQPVDLAAAAHTAAAAAAARYTAQQVSLNTPDLADPVTAQADPDRLAEVLDQLLDNALHHCQPTDTVTIAVAHDTTTAVLTVTDTGSGFPPEHRELLFQRFYRGSPRPGDDQTGGVGLTIARALTTAQRGTLTATSPGPGHGATLTLTLPLTTPSQ